MCINILTITTIITKCPRGEIGRHKGLKILALLGVPVRVWPRAPHKIKMSKILIISDSNSKSKKIKLQISNILKSENFNRPNLVIVIGGDGFMLQTLKKYKKQNKVFYGVNSGNYGFLMNRYLRKFFLRNIKASKMTIILPLEMIVLSKKNISKKSFAINEVSILRQSKQAANLSISINSRYLMKRLVSDGVLVSTPAGSTAYNLSVHGPILNLNSKKISIAPISPFRPRRWKGKLVSNKSRIVIKNLNPSKRPVSAVADNNEFRYAKKIIVKMSNKLRFKLLYDSNSSLQKKIKLEQLRKEIK